MTRLGRVSGLLLAGVFVVENPQCGDRAVGHQQMAVYFLQHDQPARAAVEARRALRQHRRDPSAYLVAALAEAERGQVPAAVELLARGIRIDPQAGDLYAALREICARDHRTELAREVFASLLAEQPGNGRLMAGLGWALAESGRSAEAVELLAEACGQPETDPFPCLRLGRIYLQEQRLPEAIEVLERAHVRDADEPEALVALGECALLQNRSAAAQERFEQALHASPAPQTTAADIARLYYDRGQRAQAIAYYERALQHGPPGATLLNNLAWTYAEEGVQLDRALELALEAVKREADNVVYLDTFAEVLHRRGDDTRALAIIRRACALEPEDGEHATYLREQLDRFSRSLAVRSGS